MQIPLSCLKLAILSYGVVFVSGRHPVEVTKLKQGIYVEKTRDVKLVSAYWRLVILLEPLTHMDTITEERKALSKLEKFATKAFTDMTGIESVGISHHITARIKWLKDELNSEARDKVAVKEADKESPMRTKRGLFNAGGWLLGKLFGLATSKDIRIIQGLINEGRNNQIELFHRTNQLASAFKTVFSELDQTKEYLGEHEQAIGHLQASLELLRNATADQKRYTNKLYRIVLIEDVMAAVEAKHRLMRDLYRSYREKRIALEGGRLTETIFPRADLRAVLERAQEKGYQSAPERWYYENCVVRPLWDYKMGGYSYIVELPLVSKTATGYRISTYPELKGNGEWIRYVVHPHVVHDEANGDVSIVRACHGKNPTLCNRDLNYRDGLKCERSLILGIDAGIGECRVQANRPSETKTVNIDINKYIITTIDDDVEARCHGEETELRRIGKGTHHVTFSAPDCQLQGATGGWVLSSVDLHEESIQLENTAVNLSRIQFPEFPEVHELPELMQLKLHQVQGLKLKQFNFTGTGHPMVRLSHKSINSYMILFVFMVLGLLAAGVLYFGCRRGWFRTRAQEDEPKMNWWGCLKRIGGKRKKKTQDHEMAELEKNANYSVMAVRKEKISEADAAIERWRQQQVLSPTNPMFREYPDYLPPLPRVGPNASRNRQDIPLPPRPMESMLNQEDSEPGVVRDPCCAI